MEEVFKLWLINFGWFTTGTYSSLERAIAGAVYKGYEVSIQKYTDGNFIEVGTWSPITGLKLHNPPQEEIVDFASK